jgi:hypothetical protein
MVAGLNADIQPMRACKTRFSPLRCSRTLSPLRSGAQKARFSTPPELNVDRSGMMRNTATK